MSTARPSLDLSTITQPSISSCFDRCPPSVTRGHALTRLTPASPPLIVCLALRLSVCPSICHAGFSARSLAHGGGGPTKINVSDKATTVPSLLASPPVIDRTHKSLSLSPFFPFQPGCTTATAARAAPATIAAEAAANN